MSQHPATRTRTRLAVALGALTLAASACGSSGTDSSPSGSASSIRQAQYADAPLAAGSSWLSDQVTDGVVHNDQYGIDDYGLGADVALALHAVDQQPGTVKSISDQLARHIKDYTSPGYGTVTSAGSTAKAVVLAQAVGEDPTAYGGQDLVAELEGTVVDHGPATGRIQDALDSHEKSATDYANVVGQAYAVRALDAAGSDQAAAATDFLLAQQCQGGWFRLDFTKDADAADQTCDGDRTSKPDLDATAFAVQALSEDDSSGAADAVDTAMTWLEKQQAADGSFGGGSGSATPNSNSTGLVGTVLAQAGQVSAAEKASGWVFTHQLTKCGRVRAADVGAIAYDDTGAKAAEKQGITVKTTDQFRRATAQALPVLQWLPADAASSSASAGPC